MPGRDVVGENEGLNALSARLGVPACALLRANGLFSAAWLLPGREIAVPAAGFCVRAAFPCPVHALRLPAWPEDAPRIPGEPPERALEVARSTGLPLRLILLARGRDLRRPRDVAARTAQCGDTWLGLADRCGSDPPALMRLNRHWGPLLPGMRVLLPTEDK